MTTPVKLIDLAGPEFWVACGVGVVGLTVLGRTRFRPLAQTVLNLGFLVVMLRAQALLVLLGAVVVWLALKLLAKRCVPRLLCLLLGTAILALFICNKLPGLAQRIDLGPVNPILSVIGFSYIALRLIELIRAVYEQRHPAPGLLGTINYLLPFHMLAAGPIQAYDEFVAQPAQPEALSAKDTLEAVERIAAGLFKKFVLATAVNSLFLTNFTAPGPWYWLWEAQMFYLWLYLDFSAYSDIAVGVGRLMGVATPENFNRPYLARNMVNFWERWHISLSLWIRRNLFFPIQIAAMRWTGGKWPLLAATLAFMIAFMLCGLWHELTINYFLWGVANAVGLSVAYIYRQLLQKKLGGKGLKQYNANPWIRAAAVVVTYEFVAFSLVLLFWP